MLCWLKETCWPLAMAGSRDTSGLLGPSSLGSPQGSSLFADPLKARHESPGWREERGGSWEGASSLGSTVPEPSSPALTLP